MAEPKSLVKKSLPWLKRLQGELDDDDSSDSSQLTQPEQKAPAKEEKEPKKRAKKKRLLRRGDKLSDTSTGDSDNPKEKPRRRLKKVTKTRRKRVADEASRASQSEDAKESADSARVNRAQRMQKMRAARKSSGDSDKMDAFRSKRKEASKAKEKKLQKDSAGAEADVEDEGTRKRPPRRPTRRKDAAKKPVKRKLRKAEVVEKEDKKTEQEASSDKVLGDDAVAKEEFVEKREDKVEKTEMSPVKTEDKDKDTASATENTSVEQVKQETDDTGKPSETEAPEIAVTACEDVNKVDNTEEKSEDGKTTDIVFASDKTVEPSNDGPKEQEKMEALAVAERAESVETEAKNDGQVKISEETGTVKTEVSDDTKINEVTIVKKEVNDEQTDEKKVSDEKTGEKELSEEVNGDKKIREETKDDKKVSAEKKNLLLDMMPIPRKVPSGGNPTPSSSSSKSFVIPKRASTKTDATGLKTAAQQAAEPRAHVSKRFLDSPVPVTILPSPSPQSSPKLPKQEQRKRTKNPVPVKKALFSSQDRALMRLSRKRNSIYMAAIELAAQDPDVRSSRKGSATKMMGYEVYDVDGKTLPDLIPHLSCATKHEMASNRELYAASFFGVSLSVPKAKGKSSSAVDECGDSDVDTRQASCYEELRFERPVDREVYQQKMYGTAFVPQRLRGRITLVVRNARFERKSTGIRFNQDRDRDEFASSLSKRYTFEKSVPRCDIPRENWQKMMRNQPGTVYLHYYNREDAERASRIFRDDDGQPLELRLELKAGAKIISSFAATRPGPQRSPPRSYSSDRPDPSPILSQNNSAHSTPSWRRERPPSSNGDGRYSKYDRGPPAQWSRGEGRYGSSLSGNKRARGLLERRSRSRSRSKSFHCQSHGFSRHENSAGPGDVERSTPNTQQGASVNRFRSDESNKITGSAVYNDADTPTPKRARTLSPHRSPTHGQDRITRVEKLEDGITGQEDKKTKSNSEVAPSSPVVFSDGGDNQREEQRPRSPSGRWQHSNGSKTHQRRDSFSNNRRDRSRWSAKNQHTNLQPDRDLNQQGRRPSPGRGGDRYKERQDSREFGHGGHGGDRRQDFRDFGPGGRGGDRFKERRGSRDFGRGGRGDVRFTERWGSRDFGRGDTYDNSGRERHMHSDRERGGHNGRSGDINSRSR